MTNNKDILMTLPIELQHRILDYFTLKECIRLCIVSKLWRSTILNASGTWRELHFKFDKEAKIKPDLRPYQAYIKEDSVKRIKVDNSPNLIHAKFVDFLVSLKCSKLNELDLNVMYLTKENAFKLVSMCGTSLTRIYIKFASYSRLPSGADVSVTPEIFLHHCQNLKKLHFSGPSSRSRSPDLLLTDLKHHHLTDLSLHVKNIDLVSFLSATPKVERLYVAKIYDVLTAPNLANELLQLCPRLKRLYLPIKVVYDAILLYDVPIHEYQQKATGICELYFEIVITNRGIRYDTFNRIIRPLISSADKTLVTLHVVGPMVCNYSHIFQYLSRHQFPSLRQLTLKLVFVSAANANDIHYFIKKNVYKLTSLELRGHADYINDDLLKIITTHAQKLEHIKLHEGQYTSEGLKQFLESMIQPGRSLKYINFICANQPYYIPLSQTIVAVSKHCIIKELELKYDPSRAAIEDLERFLEAMVKADSIIDFVYIDLVRLGNDFIDSDRGKVFLKNVKTVSRKFNLKVFQPLGILAPEKFVTNTECHIDGLIGSHRLYEPKE